METWVKRIFLRLAVAGASSFMAAAVLAEEAQALLVEPDVQPQEVEEALIDTEDFEISVFTGFIHIEDFESSVVYGARLAYHLSESFFIESNIGFAEGGESSFENLAGDVELLPRGDRDYVYYNLNLGYNILPGEAFFGSDYAFNTNFYLIGGAGATDFAGDTRFTANFGAGYQVLLTDSLAVYFSAREHLYEIEVTGDDKIALNSEINLGLSIFF
jgi:outer membrane beta-barrel protein